MCMVTLEWENIDCVCGYIGVGEHWLCVWLHWSGRTLAVCVVTLVCMVTYCLSFLGAQVSEKCSDPCGAG